MGGEQQAEDIYASRDASQPKENLSQKSLYPDFSLIVDVHVLADFPLYTQPTALTFI